MGKRAFEIVASALLFAFAVGVRALPFPDLLRSGQLEFFGNDAYYHARRILLGARDFPNLLEFDPYLNYPDGGEPIWSPLFDFLLAGLVRLTGFGAEGALPSWLVWVPPVLGGLVVVAVFLAGSRFFGRGPGLGAGFLFAILPAQTGYSRVGFLDHHAAVSLASAGILILTMVLFDRIASKRDDRWSRVGLPAALGAVLGGSLLLWPGMLLEVAIAQLLAAVAILATGSRYRSARTARAMALALGVALVVVAPFSLGREWLLWGPFSPVVLSHFQPWFLAAGAAGFALLAAVAIRVPSRAPRAVVALVLGTAILGASLFLLPELRASLGDAWGWFAKRESFQSGVLESRGLFAFGWAQAAQELSFLGLLAPVLAVLAMMERRLPGERSPRLLLLGFVTILFLATIVQSRFKSSLAPALCLLLAWCAASAGIWLRGRPFSRAAAVAVAIVLALPAALAHAPLAASFRGWIDGTPHPPHPAAERRMRLFETAEWIAAHTPPTSGWLDPEVRPEYAVLSGWYDGHALRWHGRRPPVVDNFGDDVSADNLALATAYYSADEAAGSEILEGLGARYVLFEFKSADVRDLAPESLHARLFFGDGAVTRTAWFVSGGRIRHAQHRLPAVERHRLVFETVPKSWVRRGDPAFKVYEHVAGARLVGTAEPGAIVEARLPLETPTGRRFVFRSQSVAKADGGFEIRFPYATRGAPPAVRSAPVVEVTSGEHADSVVIDEAAVQSGDEVAVVLIGPEADQGVAEGSSVASR